MSSHRRFQGPTVSAVMYHRGQPTGWVGGKHARAGDHHGHDDDDYGDNDTANQNRRRFNDHGAANDSNDLTDNRATPMYAQSSGQMSPYHHSHETSDAASLMMMHNNYARSKPIAAEERLLPIHQSLASSSFDSSQSVSTTASMTSEQRQYWTCEECSYKNVDKYSTKCALCGSVDKEYVQKQSKKKGRHAQIQLQQAPIRKVSQDPSEMMRGESDANGASVSPEPIPNRQHNQQQQQHQVHSNNATVGDGTIEELKRMTADNRERITTRRRALEDAGDMPPPSRPSVIPAIPEDEEVEELLPDDGPRRHPATDNVLKRNTSTGSWNRTPVKRNVSTGDLSQDTSYHSIAGSSVATEKASNQEAATFFRSYKKRSHTQTQNQRQQQKHQPVPPPTPPPPTVISAVASELPHHMSATPQASNEYMRSHNQSNGSISIGTLSTDGWDDMSTKPLSSRSNMSSNRHLQMQKPDLPSPPPSPQKVKQHSTMQREDHQILMQQQQQQQHVHHVSPMPQAQQHVLLQNKTQQHQPQQYYHEEVDHPDDVSTKPLSSRSNMSNQYGREPRQRPSRHNDRSPKQQQHQEHRHDHAMMHDPIHNSQSEQYPQRQQQQLQQQQHFHDKRPPLPLYNRDQHSQHRSEASSHAQRSRVNSFASQRSSASTATDSNIETEDVMATRRPSGSRTKKSISPSPLRRQQHGQEELHSLPMPQQYNHRQNSGVIVVESVTSQSQEVIEMVDVHRPQSSPSFASSSKDSSSGSRKSKKKKGGKNRKPKRNSSGSVSNNSNSNDDNATSPPPPTTTQNLRNTGIALQKNLSSSRYSVSTTTVASDLESGFYDNINNSSSTAQQQYHHDQNHQHPYHSQNQSYANHPNGGNDRMAGRGRGEVGVTNLSDPQQQNGDGGMKHSLLCHLCQSQPCWMWVVIIGMFTAFVLSVAIMVVVFHK